MLLSKLTPAETLLIRDGDQVSVKELLKYTLMDLLLKQVLVTEDVKRQPNPRDPARTYKYIATGQKFNGYACLAHELSFLLPFRRNSDTRMLFRNCVQVGYENAGSKKALHKAIRLSPALHDVFSASILETIFGGFGHTPKGLEFKSQVEKEIRQLEQELPNLLAHDREKALEKLKVIGGNIFLLQGLNFALLRETDEAFTKELTPQHGDNGCGGWTTFDTYSGDFDSSCSSDSADSSGCSSGDSGCGGGCGGD